jgi:septal ring factor EnvC (AmiA/AmiB activator)
MTDIITQKAKIQARNIAKQVTEEVTKEPGRMAKSALEQLGVVNPPTTPETSPGEAQKIAELKAKEVAFRSRRIQEIEGQITKIRQEREMRERQKLAAAKQAETQAAEAPKPLEEPAPRKRRGMLAGLGIKLGKTQAEKVGTRSGD